MEDCQKQRQVPTSEQVQPLRTQDMRNEAIQYAVDELRNETRLGNRTLAEQIVALRTDVDSLTKAVSLTNELLKTLLLQELNGNRALSIETYSSEKEKEYSSSSSSSEASVSLRPECSEPSFSPKAEVVTNKEPVAETPQQEKDQPFAPIVSAYSWSSGPDPRAYQKGFPDKSKSQVSEM